MVMALYTIAFSGILIWIGWGSICSENMEGWVLGEWVLVVGNRFGWEIFAGITGGDLEIVICLTVLLGGTIAA
jgi:hypothetical protein